MQTQPQPPLIEFHEEDHTYWRDKRRVPSVTECLKSVGLIPGMEFVSDEGVWFGIRVHRLIHLFNKGTLDMDRIPEDLVPALDGYRDFIAATGFRPTSWEQRVFDAQLWVAGCYDMRGHFPNGDDGFVDLKSGVVKSWVALQTAGYARCAGAPHARKFGLSLRGGRPRVHEYKEPNTERLFVSAVSIHNWKLNKGNS